MIILFLDSFFPYIELTTHFWDVNSYWEDFSAGKRLNFYLCCLFACMYNTISALSLNLLIMCFVRNYLNLSLARFVIMFIYTQICIVLMNSELILHIFLSSSFSLQSWVCLIKNSAK